MLISNRFAFMLNRVDYGIRHLVNNTKDRDTKRRILDAALNKMLHAIVRVYACSKVTYIQSNKYHLQLTYSVLARMTSLCFIWLQLGEPLEHCWTPCLKILMRTSSSEQGLLSSFGLLTDENWKSMQSCHCRAIDHFWRATVASYIGQGFPKIDGRWFEVPSSVELPSWEKIIAKSLDSKNSDWPSVWWIASWQKVNNRCREGRTRI